MSYSWNPIREDYLSYLRRRAILDAQAETVRNAASEISAGISTQARSILGSQREIVAAIEDSIDGLADALESGLAHISQALDSGFAALLRKTEALRVELSRQTALLEFEEQRKAMENFRYAILSRERRLWGEALSYVDAAIDGDAHSKGYRLDWRYHWFRGELLLGRPAAHAWAGIDAAAAEQAFLRAARYSAVDAPSESARAMLMASAAAYAQSRELPAKLRDMEHHASAAFASDPSLSTAVFQAARARAARGDVGPSLETLDRAAALDATVYLRAAEDGAFARCNGALVSHLGNLRTRTRHQLVEQAVGARRTIGPRAERTPEFDTCSAWRRLETVADDNLDDWGLLALLKYAKQGFEADNRAVTTLCDQLSRTVVPSPVFRMYGPGVDEAFDQAPPPRKRWQRRRQLEPWAERGPLPSPGATARAPKEEPPVTYGPWEHECFQLFDGFGEPLEHVREDAFVRVPPSHRYDRHWSNVHDSTKNTYSFRLSETHSILTRPYLLAVSPITIEQFRSVLGREPAHEQQSTLARLTPRDAFEYCNALSRSEGLPEAYSLIEATRAGRPRWTVSWVDGLGSGGYRLPTVLEMQLVQACGIQDRYRRPSSRSDENRLELEQNPWGARLHYSREALEFCWNVEKSPSYGHPGRGSWYIDCAGESMPNPIRVYALHAVYGDAIITAGQQDNNLARLRPARTLIRPYDGQSTDI